MTVFCKNGERYRFRCGIKVSQIISRIIYSSSCTAYMETHRFRKSLIEEAADRFILSNMSRNYNVSLAVLIHTRSICATVPADETKLHLCHTYIEHEQCDFLDT